jgi:hypothetical protein
LVLVSLAKCGRPSPDGATTAEARTRKLVHQSNLLALQLRQRQGELGDRNTAEASVFARARYERDCWTGRTGRAAPALAGKLGVDPAYEGRWRVGKGAAQCATDDRWCEI